MSKKKVVWLMVGIISLLLVIAVGLFYVYGGMSLVRLYKNYLSRDIPDKEYGWQDFTDQGSRVVLSGYYIKADNNGVYIWTLQGPRKFFHQEGTSIYFYQDICGVIRKLAQQEKDNVPPGENLVWMDIMVDYGQWKAKMKQGDYVWLFRVGEGKESKVIDKMGGNSNQNYPVTQLTTKQCQ